MIIILVFLERWASNTHSLNLCVGGDHKGLADFVCGLFIFIYIPEIIPHPQ